MQNIALMGDSFLLPSNGGFFLALAALVVKIKNGPTKIKLYFRSSVNWILTLADEKHISMSRIWDGKTSISLIHGVYHIML